MFGTGWNNGQLGRTFGEKQQENIKLVKRAKNKPMYATMIQLKCPDHGPGADVTILPVLTNCMVVTERERHPWYCIVQFRLS